MSSGNKMTPSHYPPLHIAPLSSADSSGVSLLDDYDSSKPQTRVSYGGRKRISIAVIVPGILIFIASAGLASALLIWLQSRRVEFHIPREDPYFLDAIVAVEGTRAPQRLDDGSLESDTIMYDDNNLSVGAAGGSHCTIASWFAGLSAGLNYGLLVKLCGAANLFSAYETMRYLKRGPIVLNHLLSAADLWLHTTASTFIHTFMTKIGVESMPATGTKINITMCPGPELHTMFNDSYYYGACAWTNYKRMVAEGLAVVGNSSSTSRSVMVDDMAVIVPSTMPDNVDNLTFNSFGLVVHCQPVVDCLVDSEQSVFCCPSFNPPYNISVMADLSGSGYSSVDMLNLTNNALSLDPAGGYPLDSVLNPYGALVILYWSLLDDVTLFPADILPGWYPIDGTVYGYMSTCNMTAYNVSLSYSTLNESNSYAFADYPVPSNFNTTSALFAALDRTLQINLANYLKTTLMTSLTFSTETFNTVLSQNMSYAAMGFASPLFERDVSTGGNSILLRSASRYPLAPLSAVLAILYTYALLALVITASSLRLTNPLASIAERFSDPARPELLLEPSAVDMFHEHPHADKLGVVMADGEGEDGEGIVRRRRTLRVESVERRLTRLSGSTMNISETS
ncbi:uncharacterized protein ARMOST_12049 [Armillaria ostoyae]|uniref:Uncharacterized protein n=1 Tax=Armillaria ostoyae TaxID=47428 RepID=A0A284RIU3_ARMOS|nr:uncharacterized protein ARMOST_12049 [Armillaria ostoyae]